METQLNSKTSLKNIGLDTLVVSSLDVVVVLASNTALQNNYREVCTCAHNTAIARVAYKAPTTR
jgi:hypothetical protein